MTFVFTDIEGSTQRWERDREAMQLAVRRHDVLLRAAIASHRGHVFKTIGDAFCAAFQSPRDALEAATEIQRRLRAEDWSSVNGLAVRIAIHAGEADERDDDYFGPALNRVARLLATAHGGQIIASEAAATLAAPTLPPSFAFCDLGTHRLKDLREPEHVLQLVAPGLSTDFAPLRSAGSSGNLPHPQTSFVGRSNDLERLRGLLRANRLVTIVGTGGVGKTRIALQAAAALEGALESSWFVDLAPLSSPSLVAATILATLAVKESEGREPLENVVEYLKTRRLLLIFDNCEHVIAEVARVTSAINARCSKVIVMVTSREALNISGERVYRLPPLEPSAAVQLFADRAKAANDRFALGQANRATVEAICARVDGLALAVELAAARARAISVEELLRRLNDRFRVLTGGNRAGLPHQQTMRALIDWSYELLSNDERTLFARLSTFAGRFTLEAAAEICSDEGLDAWSVLDVLTNLVDKSLVIAEVEDDKQQFRFLQTLSEYASERLSESGDAGLLRSRHAAFFALLAERAYVEWDTAPRPDWLSRLAPDLDNFRSALERTLQSACDVATGIRLAANIMPVFMRLSLLAEGIQWCQAALAAKPPPAAPLEARLHYVLSMLYNNQLSDKKSLAAAQAAVAMYERHDDERALTRALSQLAQQYGHQNLPTKAVQYAELALSHARRLNDPRLLAAVLQRCATVFNAEQIDEARARFAECVALFRTLGRDDETSRSLVSWGAAEAQAGCFERAIALSLEAVQLESSDARLFSVSNIAAYALVLDNFGQARDAAREAFSLAAEARHPVLLPVALSYLAAVCAQSDPVLAAGLFGYARARLSALEWSDATDTTIYAKLTAILESRLTQSEREQLFRNAEGWTEESAVLRGWSV